MTLKGRGRVSSFIKIQDPLRAQEGCSLFGIIRRDPEMVLVPTTTTGLLDRGSRARTLRTRLSGFTLLMTRQCTATTVTSSPFSESLFNSGFRVTKLVLLLNSDPLAALHTDLKLS